MSENDTPDAAWGSVETDFHPIHTAARNRDAESVRRLLAEGTPVDLLNGRASNGDGGNSALWFAAQGPLPEGLPVARALVEAGADMNLVCEHGWTPLHIAAAWGHLEVVQYLVERGADPTPPDINGQTPQQLAQAQGREEVAAWLGSLAQN
ncbi:MAG: ankyrin repeat domain-containing protein [Opitutales bacterium]